MATVRKTSGECSVLLVDDEEQFVSTLAERLQLRGINADYVCNPTEAIAVIAATHPPVVVIDILMPGMTGIALLKRIKAEHPDIRVVILSAVEPHPYGADYCRELGAFNYLMKPVSDDDLIESITLADEAAGGGRRG